VALAFTAALVLTQVAALALSTTLIHDWRAFLAGTTAAAHDGIPGPADNI
jgi:hypothetical protein